MRQNLLECFGLFMETKRYSAKTLGLYAGGRHDFFDGLQKPEKPTAPNGHRYDVVMDWFDQHWPDDLAVPDSLADHRALRTAQLSHMQDAAHGYSCRLIVEYGPDAAPLSKGEGA